jgi:uncharacterized membrane protein YeiH
MLLVVQVIIVLGVISAAVSGVLAASRRRLDWFGAVVIAMVTAVGGGTARDVFLGVRPVFWVRDPLFPTIALAAALVTIALIHHRSVPARALMIVDAVSLGAFSAGGAQIALTAGARPVMAVVMGAMTSVVGGVLRDVLCTDVPYLFRGEVYALAAIAGGAVYVVVLPATHSQSIATAAGMVAALALRGAAITFKLRVPAVPRPASGSIE